MENLTIQQEKCGGDITDLSDLLVFTIDPANAKILDDALSVQEEVNGLYTIGIHITDVCEFVKKESELGKDAERRGCTFEPNAEQADTRYMFPKELSIDKLSLIVGETRRCISVFITVDQSEKFKVVSSTMKETCIISKFRLSYQEAEEYINTSRIPKSHQLQDALHILYEASRQWKLSRLGNEGHSCL